LQKEHEAVLEVLPNAYHREALSTSISASSAVRQHASEKHNIVRELSLARRESAKFCHDP
jgi:hypothetical protein